MIFVLHYAKDDVTNRCLESLRGQGRIVVIDNGSPVEYSPPPWVDVLIRHTQNRPLIEAFNSALFAYYDDEYYCITNDTVASPGMIARLSEILDDPTVGIVAPGTNDRGAGCLWRPEPNGKTGYPDLVTGHVDNTAWGWRHDLLAAIGYPDCEGHTHRACWGSNQDFCYRARQAGYKVVAALSTYVWHAHDGGLDGVADQAGIEWLKRKWGEQWTRVRRTF